VLSLGLPVLFTWSVRTIETNIFTWDGGYSFLRYALLGAGATLFAGGACRYDLSQFLGRAQIRTGDSRLLLSRAETFVPEGVLRVVRHPWYLGGMTMVWALPREHSVSSLLVTLHIDQFRNRFRAGGAEIGGTIW
jgi:protein-S-isoprenylcysteine O-methyltransferase Ste14